MIALFLPEQLSTLSLIALFLILRNGKGHAFAKCLSTHKWNTFNVKAANYGSIPNVSSRASKLKKKQIMYAINVFKIKY